MKDLGLYKKMNTIMKSVGYLQKDKRNTFHGYDYLSEEAIKKSLHKELTENGVLFNLQVVDHKREGTMTTITVQYKFIDIDSGEELVGMFYGDGEDKGDKGLYKAITGALKYILTSSFLIPTGDDPEKDNGRGTKETTAPGITPTIDISPKEEVPTIQVEKEEPLPLTENKDVFVELLSELNAVKTKEAFKRVKESMDKLSKKLDPEQIKTAIGIIATLGKKFNK